MRWSSRLLSILVVVAACRGHDAMPPQSSPPQSPPPIASTPVAASADPPAQGTTVVDPVVDPPPQCDGPKCMPAQVDFVLASSFGTAAPKLTVILHNLDTAPLPMVEFADVACFARAWLSIDVVGARDKPVPRKACATPRATGHPAPVGVGSTVSYEVDLAALFPAAKRGPYYVDVHWDPRGIRASHGAAAGFESEPSTGSLLEFTVADAVETFTIRRGETVSLRGGAKLQFAGHSHKRTYEGQESPLLINGTFATDAAPAKEYYASVYPGRLVTFEPASGHVFELLDWDYDVSMQLRYLRY